MFIPLMLSCLLCAACAKKVETLSDGKPGYKVYCEMFEDRCFADIERLCKDKSYMIVSEHSNIIRPPLGWPENTGNWRFSSRWWKEVRCMP